MWGFLEELQLGGVVVWLGGQTLKEQWHLVFEVEE